MLIYLNYNYIKLAECDKKPHLTLFHQVWDIRTVTKPFHVPQPPHQFACTNTQAHPCVSTDTPPEFVKYPCPMHVAPLAARTATLG